MRNVYNHIYIQIAPSIPAIARHKKGTHSLQSIVSIIKGEEEEKLIEQSLQDCVLELAKVK